MWSFLPDFSSRLCLFVSLITLKDWVCMNDQAGTTKWGSYNPRVSPWTLLTGDDAMLQKTSRNCFTGHLSLEKNKTYWSRYFRQISDIIFTWNKSSQEEKTPSSLVTPEHHGEETGGEIRPMEVKLLCLLQSGSFLWNWRAPLCTTHRK